MKKTFFAFFVFFLLLAFVFSACKKNSPSSPVPADTLPPTTLTVTPTASPVLSATETLTVTVTLTVTETATATVTPTATLIVGSYIMNLHALDEDHALFGAMPGFMNSSDWSILAKVKIPSYAQYYPTADGGYGCGDGGLVISRSRGWYDQNGDIDISLGTQGFGFRLYYGGWVS